ncbi:cytochrome P450 [Streptomyces sp. NPDC091272]|uniref:cytochrome P450 n=1 Tax=Streptomyces sp. NPDC091272 TaxID=3365981 RepID=UPI00381D45AD
MLSAEAAVLSRKLVRSWLRTTDPEETGEVYAGLRGAGPLVRAPWGALLVPGHRDVRQGLVDPALVMLDAPWRDVHTPGWRGSAATEALCGSLLMQNPPEHPVNRRPLVAALTARSVALLGDPIREQVSAAVAEFIGVLRRDRTADLIGDLCKRLPAEVLCRLTGLPEQEAGRLAELATVISTGGEIRRPVEELAVADRSAEELLCLLARFTARRDASVRPEPELPSRISPFSSGQLFVMKVAGLFTTTHLLGNLCDRLLDMTVGAQRKATAPEGRGPLIEETLRWDPPVKLATRRAERRTVLGGSEVPAGTVLHLMVGAAHRDPACWPDPDVFEPDRDHRPGFPFGQGAHFCPGAALARAQAEAFLESFAEHLPAVRREGPTVRRPGPSFTEPVTLPVSLRSTAPRTTALPPTPRPAASLLPAPHPTAAPPTPHPTALRPARTVASTAVRPLTEDSDG